MNALVLWRLFFFGIVAAAFPGGCIAVHIFGIPMKVAADILSVRLSNVLLFVPRLQYNFPQVYIRHWITIGNIW